MFHQDLFFLQGVLPIELPSTMQEMQAQSLAQHTTQMTLPDEENILNISPRFIILTAPGDGPHPDPH